MNKILIIGQAPAAVVQKVPYDTTMLYDWLEEVDITKNQAQEMFIFDAVYNKFPGRGVNGHNKPTEAQMNEYWPVLELKIQAADKVWLVGNVAQEWFHSKDKTWSCNLKVLETMHPSKFNLTRYREQKEDFIKKLKQFIYGEK